MAKYYLFLLLSFFIYLNGINYVEEEIDEKFRKRTLLNYKLKKQKLYASHIDEVKIILDAQDKIFQNNRLYFFKKDKKETIVFSKIQNTIQNIVKVVDGNIKVLNSGIVVDRLHYRKYPVMLNFTLIPEDLDRFFKELYKSKKYLFIDSINISRSSRESKLYLKLTLMGYQIK